MATIAKRYFEGTDEHGGAATYGYEVAEDEQHNLVCLACGASPCEYHPTDMGREGIWVAVGPCKNCNLNTQYESGGLLDACYEEDGYRGECLLCGSSLKWSGETGKFHCADCGAECELGKRLPKGRLELDQAIARVSKWAWRGSENVKAFLPTGNQGGIEIDPTPTVGGADCYQVSIVTYCGTDAAKAAALANAELAKHGLPLIGVDAE